MPRGSGVGDTLLNHDDGLLDRGDHGGKDGVNRKHLTASVCVRTARENQRLNSVDQRASSRGTTLGPRFGSERGSTIPLQVSSCRNCPASLCESRCPASHSLAPGPRPNVQRLIRKTRCSSSSSMQTRGKEFCSAIPLNLFRTSQGPRCRSNGTHHIIPGPSCRQSLPSTLPGFDKRRPSHSKVRELCERFEKSFPRPICVAWVSVAGVRPPLGFTSMRSAGSAPRWGSDPIWFPLGNCQTLDFPSP